MTHSLEGKTVLVTGASRGIGAAIAIKLGEEGATVYGTATSDVGARKISEMLKKIGIKGEGLTLNVNDNVRNAKCSYRMSMTASLIWRQMPLLANHLLPMPGLMTRLSKLRSRPTGLIVLAFAVLRAIWQRLAMAS